MRRRPSLAAGPALAAILVILPCNSLAQPVSARDARGKIVSLPSPPRRIVSLAPAVTEILYAVGAGPLLVGVTAYCDYPAAAKRVPKIGDFRASVEKVIARKPDLIVASASANAQVLTQLQRLRIPLFVTDTQTVAQVLQSIDGVGRITGNASQASSLVRLMERKIDSVRKSSASGLSARRVLIVVDVNGPWVAGRSNYMDDIVRIAGGVNVARDAGVGWQRYSPEKALLKRPDVLLVTDHDAERVRRIPGWSSLPAVRNNRVYGNLPVALVRPGPRLPDALDAVARILRGR